MGFTVALRGQERHHLSAVVPMGVDGGLGQGGPDGQESSGLEMSVNRNWPDVNMGQTEAG